MARVYASFGNALRAVAAGYSANEFYRTLQAEGLGARRSEVLKLYAQARKIVQVGATEPYTNPHTVPLASEMAPWPTRNATGIRQNVTLLYRDRVTGEYKTAYWSTITQNGVTRDAAVREAVNAYNDTAERYNQDIIGAYHSGAYILTPGI